MEVRALHVPRPTREALARALSFTSPGTVSAPLMWGNTDIPEGCLEGPMRQRGQITPPSFWLTKCFSSGGSSDVERHAEGETCTRLSTQGLPFSHLFRSQVFVKQFLNIQIRAHSHLQSRPVVLNLGCTLEAFPLSTGAEIPGSVQLSNLQREISRVASTQLENRTRPALRGPLLAAFQP